MAGDQRQNSPSKGLKGSVSIELAVAAPVLILMMSGVVEVGFAARAYLLATDAAADGATYAMHNGWNPTAIATVISSNSTSPAISASPAAETFCGCPATTGITNTTCGATCSDGIITRRYAKVYASVTRTSFFAKVTKIPTTVTASATAQLP